MGAACLDLLATVSRYPDPDEKVRSVGFKQEGGGNAGNCLTAVARLLEPTDGMGVSLISKVGLDSAGEAVVRDLEEEGVDCSLVYRGGETTAFSYIIVDEKDKTRTCIHTPLAEPMLEGEVADVRDKAERIMGSASVVVFDGRHTEASIVLAQVAAENRVPILLDAEKPRENLEELLALADVAVCPESFAKEMLGRKESQGIAGDFLCLAREFLPRAKLVLITRGSEGSVALASPTPGGLVRDIEESISIEASGLGSSGGAPLSPFLRSSDDAGVLLPDARDVGNSCVASGSCHIPSVVDTTGAGDAFIGAMAFALARPKTFAESPLSRVILLASVVAGLKCQQVGARSGLPSSDLLDLDKMLDLDNV